MKKLTVLIAVICLLLLATYPRGVYGAGGKFQIEFYDGYATINASGLNLLPQSDRLIRDFYFPQHLEWKRINGFIASWSGESDGEYKELKGGYPFGLRLKYDLSPTLAVSLGFRSLSRRQDSAPSYGYTQSGGYTSYLDRRRYQQYTLSAKGTAALLGIHLKTKSSGRFSVEGHVSAGPLFARCNYVSSWYSELIDVFSSSTPLLYTESGSLTQEGDGTGIAVDAGVRLNIALGSSFGVFVGAGYAYQSASNISGIGREDRNGIITDWDGQWQIKNETLSAFWGQQLIRFPTSYWPEGGTAPGEDFNLDLSGFQLQVGLYFRF